MAFSHRIETDPDGDLFIWLDNTEKKIRLWAFPDGSVQWEFKNSYPEGSENG